MTDLTDNTGKVFQGRPEPRRKYRMQEFERQFRNPKQLMCPECSGGQWIIVADDHPLSQGLMMMYCRDCKAVIPPVEMRKPQMDDHRAKELGLYIPDAIEMDLDIER